MEIGLFQLENLAMTLMPYAMLDLRVDRAPVDPEIDPLLARAELVTSDRAVARLAELGVGREIPVVLLSEDGAPARALRPTLERAGFTQIYVVKGGTRGLLRELREDG